MKRNPGHMSLCPHINSTLRYDDERHIFKATILEKHGYKLAVSDGFNLLRIYI